MWNKKDTPASTDPSRPDGSPSGGNPSDSNPPSNASSAAARPAAVRPGSGGRSEALIGAATSIHGEIRGDEDLLVLGRIDGKIECKKNRVTIGSTGNVKADVYGASIVVEGKVNGNLFAGEQIVVKSSGEVHGNLVGPRVSLEDGARFKGSIDMGGPTSGAPTSEPRKEEPASASKPGEAGRR